MDTTQHATAIRFSAPHTVQLVDQAVPPPGHHQVVVQSLASLISTGTELTAFSGQFPPNSAWARYIRYPWLAGYSNVGRVVAAGPGVTSVAVGDRLASMAPHATFATVDVASAMRVPPTLADDEATFWTLARTVINGVRQAAIQLGDAVVIVGAGLLGQMAAGIAALSGAWPLIMVDLAPSRLQLAGARGVTHTLATDVAAARDEIQAILGGRGADVVFEVTGSPTVIPPALRLARSRGRVVLLGSSRGPALVDFHDEVHTLGLHIIGAHISTAPQHETPYAPWTLQRNGALFFDLLAARRLHVDDLISHHFAYSDAQDAYDFLLADRTRAMGVILTYPE